MANTIAARKNKSMQRKATFIDLMTDLMTVLLLSSPFLAVVKTNYSDSISSTMIRTRLEKWALVLK